jgi:hypothetical protein
MLHLKSSLIKKYLMSHLLHTIFNFLLNYVLLFLQQGVGLSTSITYLISQNIQTKTNNWVEPRKLRPNKTFLG